MNGNVKEAVSFLTEFSDEGTVSYYATIKKLTCNSLCITQILLGRIQLTMIC